MGSRRHLLALTFLLGAAGAESCMAQDSAGDPSPPHLGALERVLSDRAGERAADQLIAEEVEDRCFPPLDLNGAAVDELARLPFLAPHLARAIADRLAAFGPFASWQEVGSIPGIDAATLDALRRCATLRTPPEAHALADADVRVRVRTQREERPREGFLSGAYPGPREAIATRLAARVGAHARAGIATERDAGEHSLADHLAGHVTLEDCGAVKNVTLGDYFVSEGQGLVFRRRSGFGKGGDALAATTAGAPGLTPFASSSEAGSFRGAAAHIRAGGTSLLGFVSSTRLDASVDSLSGEIISIDGSGLHRAASELGKADRAASSVAGGAVSRSWRHGIAEVRAGMTGVATRFSAPVNPTSPLAFGGDRAWAVGAHVDVSVPGVHAFAEAARAHSSSVASILGVSAALPRATQATVLLRSYPPGFVSLHGCGFGERGGELRNETGVYFGLQWEVPKTVTLQAAFDLYRFPAASGLIDVPSAGHDATLLAEWRLGRGTALSVRWRRDSKDASFAALDAAGRDIRPVVARTQESVRAEVRARASARWEARFRAEYSSTTRGVFAQAESGVLLSADLRARPYEFVRLVCRAILFRTDSYDSRVYALDADLPGSATNAAMSGSGARVTALAEVRAGAGTSLTAKWSRTVQHGAAAIGSGSDSVAGDAQGMLSLQLDARF